MLTKNGYQPRTTQQDRTVIRIDQNELRSTLSILRGLPDQQRLVTIMYYANEMSYREIGAVLDIEPSEARRLHQEAKETLTSVL